MRRLVQQLAPLDSQTFDHKLGQIEPLSPTSCLAADAARNGPGTAAAAVGHSLRIPVHTVHLSFMLCGRGQQPASQQTLAACSCRNDLLTIHDCIWQLTACACLIHVKACVL